MPCAVRTCCCTKPSRLKCAAQHSSSSGHALLAYLQHKNFQSLHGHAHQDLMICANLGIACHLAGLAITLGSTNQYVSLGGTLAWYASWSSQVWGACRPIPASGVQQPSLPHNCALSHCCCRMAPEVKLNGVCCCKTDIFPYGVPTSSSFCTSTDRVVLSLLKLLVCRCGAVGDCDTGAALRSCCTSCQPACFGAMACRSAVAMPYPLRLGHSVLSAVLPVPLIMLAC